MVSPELIERARINIVETARLRRKEDSPEDTQEAKKILGELRADCIHLLEEHGDLQKRLLIIQQMVLYYEEETNGSPVGVWIKSWEKNPSEGPIDIVVQGIDEHLELRASHSIMLNPTDIILGTWREVTLGDARNYQEVVNLVKDQYSKSVFETA